MVSIHARPRWPRTVPVKPWKRGWGIPFWILGLQTMCTRSPISNFWITQVHGGSPRSLKSFLNLYRVFFLGPLWCAMLFSLLCSFNLRYVEAGDVSCFVQDLCKTRTGSPGVPGYEFLDVEAGFAQDFDNKSAVLFPCTLDIEDL